MSRPAGLALRPVTDADWPRVWPVWHEVVAPGDTYCYEPASTVEQGRALWLGGGETWLAETQRADGPTGDGDIPDGDIGDGGAVLGTYHLTPNQPGAGAHIANASYMVAAAARGRGLGRTLVEHSLERARALGYRGVQFNAVAATNTGAIGLYRRLGFTTIGLVPGGFRHPAEGYVDLHVMFRPL